MSESTAVRHAWRKLREKMMALALCEARTAFFEDEVPVGAVLAQGETVLVSAHNLCVRQNDPTAHAELICLSQGARLLGGRLDGCTLYVTLEPCAMCAGAAVNAKLPRLVYGAFDARAGCCGSVFELTDHCFLHSVEVWGGVCEAECAALLRAFFAKKRIG